MKKRLFELATILIIFVAIVFFFDFAMLSILDIVIIALGLIYGTMCVVSWFKKK